MKTRKSTSPNMRCTLAFAKACLRRWAHCTEKALNGIYRKNPVSSFDAARRFPSAAFELFDPVEAKIAEFFCAGGNATSSHSCPAYLSRAKVFDDACAGLLMLIGISYPDEDKIGKGKLQAERWLLFLSRWMFWLEAGALAQVHLVFRPCLSTALILSMASP